MTATEMSTDTVIRVRDLHKRYGETRAVDGVSFEVRRGEVFGLLGPNGAGKTTTVEILEGLRQPDAGDVSVLGIDVAMDAAARRSLWDIVTGLKDAGKTILLTTHYLEEAEILCDRLAIMDHGKILEAGTVTQLVDSRFKERAVRFDRVDELTDARLVALPGVTSVKHEDDEVVLYTRDVAGTIGAILDATDALGVEVSNLGVRRATLEDVFLDMTGRALRD